MGIEIKGEAVKAVVGGDGGIRAPREEVIESELDGWKKLIPKVEGELKMDGGEGCDDVVLRGAYRALREVGTVVVGGNVVDGRGGGAGAKESSDVSGGLVVQKEIGDGVASVREETEDRAKGVEIGGGGFRRLGGEANVTTEGGDKDVFVALAGTKGKATCEIRRDPLRAVNGGADSRCGGTGLGKGEVVAVVGGEGVGGSGRVRASDGAEGGGGRDTTGRAQTLTHQIEMAFCSCSRKRGIARYKLGSEAGYLDISVAQGTEESGHCRRTESAVPLRDERGVVDVADGGEQVGGRARGGRCGCGES